ncbi:MAG: hypothetical protein KIT41_06020 [Pyrinomonadaceae bacterium]|nr:hypothetical protein [Pyrinomonadaceae bacterium]
MLAMIVCLFASCGPAAKNQVDPALDSEMPQKMLWAWERPEDLRFIDTNEFGVAFLAQTVTLTSDQVNVKRRRQPLEVPDGTYLVAVTRIETVRNERQRPTYDDAMIRRTVEAIVTTLALPGVRGIQIDFDAVVSERSFYRRLMTALRVEMDSRAEGNARIPLTMTSLASWCTGDAWFNDFPVAEAVPMAFQMGADADKLRAYLRNGKDWREPLCRGSYGISLEEGKLDGMRDGRRIYYFKNSAWRKDDLSVP